MNLLKLREIRLKAEEKRKYTEKERLTFKKAQEILKNPVYRPAKSYREYLEASKPITRNLAPVGAKPPLTYGDSHRHRILKAVRAEKGFIDFKEIPYKKDGTINVAKYERILKEKYGRTFTNK